VTCSPPVRYACTVDASTIWSQPTSMTVAGIGLGLGLNLDMAAASFLSSFRDVLVEKDAPKPERVPREWAPHVRVAARNVSQLPLVRRPQFTVDNVICDRRVVQQKGIGSMSSVAAISYRLLARRPRGKGPSPDQPRTHTTRKVTRELQSRRGGPTTYSRRNFQSKFASVANACSIVASYMLEKQNVIILR
jgi:hypothetical protein